MSISLLADQFDHDVIPSFLYWYERQPFTAFDPDMSSGSEEVFSISNMLAATNNTQMAFVSGLAVTRTPGVSLKFVVGPDSQTNPTRGYPPALRSSDASWDDGTRVTQNMSLDWANNTGSGLTTAQQLTYFGGVKTLTTADKVLYGLTQALTAEDRHYIKKFNINQQGLRPLSLAESLERVFRRSIIEEITRTYDLTVGTTAQYIGPFAPPPGEILVVRSVAADVESSDVGSLIQWSWLRDNQRKHLAFLLDNHPGLSYPWPIWMVATQRVGFNIKASTAPSHTVPIRIRYWRVKYTTVIQGLLGVLNTGKISTQDQHILEQIRAGVIA